MGKHLNYNDIRLITPKSNSTFALQRLGNDISDVKKIDEIFAAAEKAKLYVDWQKRYGKAYMDQKTHKWLHPSFEWEISFATDGIYIPFNIKTYLRDKPYYLAKLKVRTEKGGFGLEDEDYDIFKIFKKAAKVVVPPKPIRKTKVVLAGPYGFNSESITIGDLNGWATIKNPISQCRVLGLVSIGENLKLDFDIKKPDDGVWFHVDCRSSNGSTFDLLTDGEKWYPVDRYKKRVTNKLNPKKTVNLKDLGSVDKNVIKFAIDAFLESIE